MKARTPLLDVPLGAKVRINSENFTGWLAAKFTDSSVEDFIICKQMCGILPYGQQEPRWLLHIRTGLFFSAFNIVNIDNFKDYTRLKK